MTDNNAAAVFEAHAANYDSERRRLIPPYDRFYGCAVEALSLSRRPLEAVLDLGAGTGLLSRLIAERHPEAHLTLLDGSPAMLGRARSVLGERAQYLHADLTDPLPPGPWDAIVSALAIHHLSDPEKARLSARVHEALMPGGVFVNAEQVAGPSGLFDDAYSRWHQRAAAQAGASPQEWDASVQRMAQDRTSTVERQLDWLRQAGFSDADCLFKDHSFAVIVARRAG